MERSSAFYDDDALGPSKPFFAVDERGAFIPFELSRAFTLGFKRFGLCLLGGGADLFYFAFSSRKCSNQLVASGESSDGERFFVALGFLCSFCFTDFFAQLVLFWAFGCFASFFGKYPVFNGGFYSRHRFMACLGFFSSET